MLNPCGRIIALHLHTSNVRSYDIANTSEKVSVIASLCDCRDACCARSGSAAVRARRSDAVIEKRNRFP